MLTMEDLFSAEIEQTGQAGFRLDYLEVLNWGTFNRTCWRVRAEGDNALLTGDIGSGKSTLVDALTCLLVPHHKIVFNKAAGADTRERNFKSYIKGEYKKEKGEITKRAQEVYLRPDNDTYSVIIGNFRNKGYGENICLAQVFWMGKEGKVEKLLVISSGPLTIQEHFSGFADINDLRKKLRRMEGVQLFNENFTQYSDQFRRLFGMTSDKAIELFYQTVSMKSVSSLTTFVREHMLEQTDVKDQVASLLKRFDDLNRAHAAVVNTREQYQILKPLTESCTEYEKVSQEIEQVETMLEVMPAFFAYKKLQLLDEAVAQEEEELEKENRKLLRLNAESRELQDRLQAILQDIANNGGRRLEQITAEIQHHEQDKAVKRNYFEEYERLAAKCGLRAVREEKEFEDNLREAAGMSAKCLADETSLRDKRDNLVSELRRMEADHASEDQELNSLKARKTQIPAWLVDFRSRLCKDLRINEEELPFAGELLKVKDEEAAEWEGAIERLLRDTGISLLVPSSHYKSVSRYVNDNPLKGADGRGIRLTYLDAGHFSGDKIIREAGEDCVTAKISIRQETPFYEWLENYLERNFGSFVCVDVTKLQQVPYGITSQGLIKSGRIKHTKDDRRRLNDRRNYVLGWSNVEKIQALEASLSRLREQILLVSASLKAVEAEEKKNQALQQTLAMLLFMKDFSRLDWQYHVRKIHHLQKEQQDLLHENTTLALLEEKKQEVKRAISRIAEQEKESMQKTGGSATRIQGYREQQSDARSELEQLTRAIKDRWFPLLETQLSGVKLTLRGIDHRREDVRRKFLGENGELKKLRTRQTNLRSSIEKRMREIKEHSRAEYNEIAESIDARHEYRQRFDKLVSEDLKRHEERFKEELNKNTINSIAVFDSQLEKHEKDIRQKIHMINQHLHEIVYNSTQDTYIKILMDPTQEKEVRQFREDLRRCYIHSLSNNTELYTEEKYEQVKRILDRFASADSRDRDWTGTVTDVRKWFVFNATERFRADDSEKEFYEGSAGKSGGQKEKLAYTILASALAYQFGLQFGESKSRSFRFVVIDEAFGRGSDESTRYALELFKKLNLQLLIVTPLQKIHVIEGHVNSFHFISNPEGNDSQVTNLNKKEYEAEKLKHEAVTPQNVLS